MGDGPVGTRSISSSSSLEIQFLPRSIVEQWIFARSPDETTTILEEILEIYTSLDERLKEDCSNDINSIVRQTILCLRIDSLSVILNGLKLLEAVSVLHSKEFISSFDDLFPILQSFMDHPRVALRHHSLRLVGSLVVRIPVNRTLKYVFSLLERKPYHPEIPLKCAALALLSIQPVPSNPLLSSCSPLISRILGLAGEYVLNEVNGGSSDPRLSPRAPLVTDSAKDVIAIGAMIFSVLSLARNSETESSPSDSLEDILRKKIPGLLGTMLPRPVIEDLTRRALQSDFPSLITDPYLSELSTIAMETSLNQIDASISAPSPYFSQQKDTSMMKHESSSILPSPTIAISQTPSTLVPPTYSPRRDSSNIFHPMSSETGFEIPVLHPSISPRPLPQESSDLYRPSWMTIDTSSQSIPPIEHDLEGYHSTLESPWAIARTNSNENHPDEAVGVDRTKLMSIKKVSRKSGSRRARTANDLPPDVTPNPEWTDNSIPATAHARMVSVSNEEFPDESVAVSNTEGIAMERVEPLSRTPIEVGLYLPDGKREHRHVIPKHRKFSNSRPPRVNSITPNEFQEQPNDQDDQDEFRKFNSAREAPTLRFSLPDAEEDVEVKYHVSKSARPADIHSKVQKGDFQVYGSPSTSTQKMKPVSIRSEDSLNPPLRKEEIHFNESERGAAPQASSTDSFEYWTVDEIKPCDRPQREISRLGTDLIQQDWPEIFHTLNIVRQLAIHHKTELLQSGQLHSIILGLNKQVENLRSTAAKNAILALGDLYSSLKTGMDPEVNSSSSILTKRLSDTSVFINESVLSAFSQMILSVSINRSHAALMLGVENKNPIIRGQSVRLVLLLYSSRGSEFRSQSFVNEVELVMSKLPKIVRDTSPESRKYGRELVKELIDSHLQSKDRLIDLLGADLVTKALQMTGSNLSATQFGNSLRLTGPRSRDTSPAPARASSPSLQDSQPIPRNSTQPKRSNLQQSLKLNLERSNSKEMTNPTENLMVSGTSPRAMGGIAMGLKKDSSAVNNPITKAQQDNYPELVRFQAVSLGLSNKNWQERRDNLTVLCDLLLDNYQLFTRANKVEKCVESILEKFEDGSVKVILHAISCMLKIHQSYPLLLSKMLPISLPAVLGVESSATKQISVEGGQLLDAVLKDSPETLIAQQLIRIAQHEKERIRAASFRAMSKYITFLSKNSSHLNDDNWRSTCDIIIRRHFFPVTCQSICSANTKPEIKTSAIETLRMIQSHTSDYIGNWTDSPLYKEEIKRLLL